MIVQEGEVYFLKLTNGEDLLVQLIGDEPEYLYITQPYRIEAIQSPSSMIVTTGIMRWIPFESMMEQKIRLDKTHIMTYILADETVAERYLNSISKEVRQSRAEELGKIAERAIKQAISNIANNKVGTIH
jgi:hypothetical protein